MAHEAGPEQEQDPNQPQENEHPAEAAEATPETEQQVEGAAASTDEELTRARDELARHQDALVRLQAEMDNLRKRQARELEKAHKFALERFMNGLLPVRDSLERGLQAAAEGASQGTLSVEKLVEGKELTLKMLTKVMEDFGLAIIDPKGQPFDPEWHEAVSMVPTEGVAANTVIEVIQKGFSLNDRIIRPAMVVVAA